MADIEFENYTREELVALGLIHGNDSGDEEYVTDEED